MISLRLAAFLSAFAAICGTSPASAGPFSGIYAFGDSLSDAGNVFLATGGAKPGPPYAAGHFSNGPTWVEILSTKLGLGPLQPSLAGGTDFAFGGAVTGPAVPGANTAVPNITQQVGLFSLAVAGHAPASALYTVWIGSNDIFTALDDIGAGTLSVPGASAALAAAAMAAAAAVHVLAGEGAKTFVVPLIPDLGKTPLLNGDVTTSALGSALAAAFNAALIGVINAYVTSDQITVHFVDTFSLIDAAVTDPGAFGYANVTDACYPGTLAGGVPACATPNAFLFWDSVHPTAPGHQRVAAVAAAELPEPGMFTAFVVAALSLAMWRRARLRV